MYGLQVFSDVHDCALEYLYSVLNFGERDVIDRQQLEEGLKEIGALQRRPLAPTCSYEAMTALSY